MPPRKLTNTDHATDALWADAFCRALVMRVREPEGKGWLTSEEFKTRTKMCFWRVKKFLTTEIAAGRMDKFAGTALASNGKPRPQFWYRPKLKKL